MSTSVNQVELAVNNRANPHNETHIHVFAFCI